MISSTVLRFLFSSKKRPFVESSPFSSAMLPRSEYNLLATAAASTSLIVVPFLIIVSPTITFPLSSFFGNCSASQVSISSQQHSLFQNPQSSLQPSQEVLHKLPAVLSELQQHCINNLFNRRVPTCELFCQNIKNFRCILIISSYPKFFLQLSYL